jgi:peptide/nickel transport system permease protein
MSSTSWRNIGELEQSDDQIIQAGAPHRKPNWALIIGLLIVGFIVTLALIGPKIAPKDPLAEETILKIGGKWEVPPFSIFTPGYPLGSDQFGRDLWSRLLWGIKPTLEMIFIVATIRLVLGVMIGMLAGWLKGRTARLLDSLIELAVSIPVLLVALGAIAIVGTELGLWAFVIGLSLTGWVDTAQQVREQTRIIKGQTFIEAARALGSSNRQVLVRHVVRQIMPMLLMLFAFELSSTLMTTAGLGFLGYYIGGDVWVEVRDFVARRLSGMPELGQMLATSWTTLTQPWAMVAVGTTIFITILGFNLVGEGLRQSLDVMRIRRRGLFPTIREKGGFWLDEHVFYPIHQVFSKPVVQGTVITIFVAGFIWFGGVKFIVPRFQAWLSESGSSQEVLANAEETPTPQNASNTTIPNQAQAANPTPEAVIEPQILWERENPAGFASGAVYSAQNNAFYVVDTDGILFAYNLDGEILWQTQITGPPFQTNPVVDNDGNIYVLDNESTLSAYRPDGSEIWEFTSQAAPSTTSGLLLTSQNTLVYVVSNHVKGFIQAVSLDGNEMWVLESENQLFYAPLNSSLDGRYIFFRTDIVDTTQPALLHVDTDLEPLRYYGGEDGFNYMLSGRNLIRVDLTQSPLQVSGSYNWETSSDSNGGFASVQVPVGLIIEPEQIAHFLYTTPGGGSSAYWVEFNGQVLQNIPIRLSSVSLQTMDENYTMFVCGGRSFDELYLSCVYLSPDSATELWKINLGKYGPALGGFAQDRVYYIATGAGKIYAITAVENSPTLAAPTSEALDQPTDQPGVAWQYPLDEQITYGPVVGDDGSIFVSTRNDDLVILNPDGTLRSQKPIYKPWLIFNDNRNSYQEVVYPFLSGGKNLIAISDENTVYGIDEQGELAWEEALQNPLGRTPTWQSADSFYLVDSKSVLYAFDPDGLKWTYAPPAGMTPGNGIPIGPDGTVFYSYNDHQSGYITAISPVGLALWTASISSNAFNDFLQLSPDGKLLNLKNEIYQTTSGAKLNLDFTLRVDRLFFGEDGKYYFVSDQTAYQWKDGPEGVEITATAPFSAYLTAPYPPYIRVSKQGIMWIYLPSSTRTSIVFLQPDGKYLGRYDQPGGSFIANFDDQNVKVEECKYEDRNLICDNYDPLTDKIEGTWAVENIPDFILTSWSTHRDGYVYVQSRQGELVKIYLGNP